MPKIIRIQDIAQHVGKEVTLQGWLYNRTDKGRLQFLQVRDGTGFAQCVVFKKEVSPEVFEAAQSLTQESSFVVTGTIRQDDRAPASPAVMNWASPACACSRWPRTTPFSPKSTGSSS